MSKQSVSVIIPVYNVVTFLEDAIKSVLSQDGNEVEIIVVNDGSNVEASGIIAAICLASEKIRLINQPNMGQSIARRNGIKHAKGDYIIFLDADDFLAKGAISRLVAALDNNPAAIASYGQKILMHVSETEEVLETYVMPTPEIATSGDILPALLQCAPLLSNGNICIRRVAAEKIVFPENIRQAEDWVTWCRLALLGDIVYAGGEPVVSIRIHSNSVSNGVFDKPRTLLKARDIVFKDKAIIARIGKRKIAEYRMEHTRYLHVHFFVGFKKRHQNIMALKHKMLRNFFGKLYLLQKKYNDIFFPDCPPKTTKIRVLHVVKWFHAGGAERLLSGLLEHSNPEPYEHIVLSLSDRKERLAEIKNTLGIPYYSVDIQRDKNNFAPYLKAFLLIRKANPDIIKTWLPPSNMAGGIMANILRKPVIWGIHDATGYLTPHTERQRSLSRFLPDQIICCSQAVYDVCRKFGYNENLLKVINNGTDTQAFRYSPEGRKRIRAELGISDDSILIGMVAEYVSLKRHKNFMVAAKVFLSSYPNAQFLFCGRDTGEDNVMLKKYLQVLGMEKQMHLLGIRNDMADIYSALDIHTLNSEYESFGLAVTEAVACETLCVATDVGIMKALLQDVGQVIPVLDDPNILANAWKKSIHLTDKEKSERLKRGRDRIAQHYSITEAARKYDEAYNDLYNKSRKKHQSIYQQQKRVPAV